MSHFIFYDKHDILSLTRLRRYETKLGERVECIADRNELEKSLRKSSAE